MDYKETVNKAIRQAVSEGVTETKDFRQAVENALNQDDMLIRQLGDYSSNAIALVVGIFADL